MKPFTFKCNSARETNCSSELRPINVASMSEWECATEDAEVCRGFAWQFMQAIKLTPPLVPPALCTLGFLACFHSFLSNSSKAGNNGAIYPWDRECTAQHLFKLLFFSAVMTNKSSRTDCLYFPAPGVGNFIQSRGEMEMDIRWCQDVTRSPVRWICQPPIPADCQTHGIQLIPFAWEPAQPSPSTLVLHWRWMVGSERIKRTTYYTLRHSTQTFLANWITMLEAFQSDLVRRTRLLLSLKGTARRIKITESRVFILAQNCLWPQLKAQFTTATGTSQKKCGHLHHSNV